MQRLPFDSVFFVFLMNDECIMQIIANSECEMSVPG